MIGQDADKVQIDTPDGTNQDEWTYQPDTDQANGALKMPDMNIMLKIRIMKESYDKDENARINLIARLYDEGTYHLKKPKKLSVLVSEWRKLVLIFR